MSTSAHQEPTLTAAITSGKDKRVSIFIASGHLVELIFTVAERLPDVFAQEQ
jgi:hypothetical protein